MPNRKPNKDPIKRAAKREARRDAVARGAMPTDRAATPSAQMSHASSGEAIRKRRQGERRSTPD